MLVHCPLLNSAYVKTSSAQVNKTYFSLLEIKAVDLMVTTETNRFVLLDKLNLI